MTFVLDCQTHWYPPAYLESILDAPGYPTAKRAVDGYRFFPRAGEEWPLSADYIDLDVQLDDAAAAGVDAILTNPAVFGDVAELPLADAVAATRLLNDQLASAEERYPGRVFGAAVVPMQDAVAAVAELERATQDLGLKAVTLHSNIAGRRIGKRESWPLYERIEQLGVPVLLHPTLSIAAAALQDGGLEGTLGFMLDSSVGALSLVYDGVLDAYPSLQVVHPHLGGILPYLRGRIEEEDSKHWSAGRRAELRLVEYLRRNFYTDTVSQLPEALALARAAYGIERIIFSSDFPYWPRAKGVSFVRDNLDPAAAESVFSGNAMRLFGITI
ncbi:MAG: amidohydrolase family protein [Solirubrobacterales bacterium]